MNIFLIISILFILIVIYVSIYNNAIYLKNKVEQSISSVDVYLKQRFNLIPNLVECVKSYSNYERDLLENIVKLREDCLNDDKNISKNLNYNNNLNNLIARLESYPEIKASGTYIKLQQSLIKMENQIQAARRILNIDVTKYNTFIKVFPNSILLFGFKEEELFKINDEEEKNNIDIEV